MADWTDFKVSGVTTKTPKSIMLGAGTLYKNLKFDSETKKWAGSIYGATSGGSKFSIKPELTDIEVDGVLVKAKGLTVKTGETATIETNMVELTKEWVETTIIGKAGVSEDERFDMIESKAQIEDGDYIEGFAYVGFMTTGDPIIIIFDSALCTSGFEGEGKNKENAVFPATFECCAELAEGETNTLPYHIYVPKDTTVPVV